MTYIWIPNYCPVIKCLVTEYRLTKLLGYEAKAQSLPFKLLLSYYQNNDVHIGRMSDIVLYLTKQLKGMRIDHHEY